MKNIWYTHHQPKQTPTISHETPPTNQTNLRCEQEHHQKKAHQPKPENTKPKKSKTLYDDEITLLHH